MNTVLTDRTSNLGKNTKDFDLNNNLTLISNDVIRNPELKRLQEISKDLLTVDLEKSAKNLQKLQEITGITFDEFNLISDVEYDYLTGSYFADLAESSYLKMKKSSKAGGLRKNGMKWMYF